LRHPHDLYRSNSTLERAAGAPGVAARSRMVPTQALL
jgi:hypothetical protein